MPLLKGTVSMTMDGKQACQKLMGRIKNPDLGSMRILHLPHSWNHCMGDHMIVFTVWPISAQETMVTTKWLVHKDAVEGVDYDPERMRKVWDATNDRTVAWPKRTSAGSTPPPISLGHTRKPTSSAWSTSSTGTASACSRTSAQSLRRTSRK